MVGTVFFTTVGFVLAFVANARNPVPGLINYTILCMDIHCVRGIPTSNSSISFCHFHVYCF